MGASHLPLRPSFSFRSTKRLTITLPHSIFENLIQRSCQEGRSMSNLAAFLLELSLEHYRP